ncbi:hypothetical protein Musp01_21460 [Muricauda sp. NBRC 101325]|nr:hypothetical protein Musp01_21460 [Muricauda sp. NBRC 101325]
MTKGESTKLGLPSADYHQLSTKNNQPFLERYKSSNPKIEQSNNKKEIPRRFALSE